MSADTLTSLGRRADFAAQLADAVAALEIARVLAVHRSRITVEGRAVERCIDLTAGAASLGITAGDWVMIDDDGPVVRKCLQRCTVFRRRAAG